MSLRTMAIVVGLAGALGINAGADLRVAMGHSAPRDRGQGRGNAAREQRAAKRRRNIAKRSGR